MHYLGYITKLFVVYLKVKFNWASCILPVFYPNKPTVLRVDWV